jgi:hypothetical protein
LPTYSLKRFCGQYGGKADRTLQNPADQLDFGKPDFNDLAASADQSLSTLAAKVELRLAASNQPQT